MYLRNPRHIAPEGRTSVGTSKNMKRKKLSTSNNLEGEHSDYSKIARLDLQKPENIVPILSVEKLADVENKGSKVDGEMVRAAELQEPQMEAAEGGSIYKSSICILQSFVSTSDKTESMQCKKQYALDVDSELQKTMEKLCLNNPISILPDAEKVTTFHPVEKPLPQGENYKTTWKERDASLIRQTLGKRTHVEGFNRPVKVPKLTAGGSKNISNEEIIELVLIPVGYPERSFTQNHLGKLFDLLSDLSNDISSAECRHFVPRFNGAYLNEGTIIVSFVDERSKVWLANTIEGAILDREVVHTTELIEPPRKRNTGLGQQESINKSLQSEYKTNRTSLPVSASQDIASSRMAKECKTLNTFSFQSELKQKYEMLLLSTPLSILPDTQEQGKGATPVEIVSSHSRGEKTLACEEGEVSTSALRQNERKNEDGFDYPFTPKKKVLKRTHDCSTISEEKGTYKLALVPEGYPEKWFTQQQFWKLHNLIREYCCNHDRDFDLGSFGTYTKKGALIVCCVQESSKAWLASTIEGLRLDGIVIYTAEQGESSLLLE